MLCHFSFLVFVFSPLPAFFLSLRLSLSHTHRHRHRPSAQTQQAADREEGARETTHFTTLVLIYSYNGSTAAPPYSIVGAVPWLVCVMTSSSSMMSAAYSSSPSEAAQAAMIADLHTLKCETGFLVAGLQDGEAECAPFRIAATLIAASVASAWFSQRKSIKMLLLFFWHWLRYVCRYACGRAVWVQRYGCGRRCSLLG